MFTAKDTDRPEEIRECTFTWVPEETICAVDFLLVYLGYNTSPRTEPVMYHINNSKRLVPMRRGLHKASMGSAMSLVHPGRRWIEGRFGRFWYLQQGWSRVAEDTPSRLAGAGIDAKTVTVTDPYRWALAWMQLTENKRSHYSSARQKQLVAAGTVAPPLKPKVYTYRRLSRDGLMRLRSEEEERMKEKDFLRKQYEVMDERDFGTGPVIPGHGLY